MKKIFNKLAIIQLILFIIIGIIIVILGIYNQMIPVLIFVGIEITIVIYIHLFLFLGIKYFQSSTSS